MTSNTGISVRHYIKSSIPCGRGRILDYDESFDLLNDTKVTIEFTAISKQHKASFTVDLGEISMLPETVVASSECRTQEVYHTPLMNSKAASVVMETPFDFSRNSVADNADGTPTKRNDIYSGPVDSFDAEPRSDTEPSLEQPVQKEPRKKVLENVTNLAKRKADTTDDRPSTKRIKKVQKTYGHGHRTHLSSLSREIEADESNDSASEKENVVAKRHTRSKANKPLDSVEDHACSNGGHQEAMQPSLTDKSLKEKEMIPASQETTISGASPRSGKSKLVIVFSGSEFATNNKAATAFLKRHVRILDTVSPQVDFLWYVLQFLIQYEANPIALVRVH
jgi:hypothetical protein